MDTIAAIATAHSPAAVGILRLSGPKCFAVLEQVFQPGRGGFPLVPRQMVYGSLWDGEGRLLDRVLAVTFPAPHSYTGEDCAELHCHGSAAVLAEGLQSLLLAGARQARAGEFTRRAFLNGRMDLTEAEAVIDLIEAESADQARNAAGQTDGLLRRQVEEIYEGLLAVTARFYAVVDYPDEEIEEVDRAVIETALARAATALRAMLATCARGNILKNGLSVALIGRPNAGKSSLLNVLLGRERAIVTPVAGTTRDTVEEKAQLGGVTVLLQDTAGLRETADMVEQQGIERAKAAAQSAALALLVLDCAQPLGVEDEMAMEAAELAETVIAVLNKSDLPSQWDGSLLAQRFAHQVRLCAKTGEGLDELEALIGKLFGAQPPRGELLTNARQAAAARRALAAVERAAQALAEGMSLDAVLCDGEQALAALGELNGRSLSQDVIETIFSRFCVGK